MDFLRLKIFIYESLKKPVEKKERTEDQQTLTDYCSAHRRSQAKCQLVQTSYIKRIKFFLSAM